MIPAEQLLRMREVAQTISADCAADTAKREGMEFTGRNVGQALGELAAQVDALARMVDTLLAEQDGA